jgi:hypothetical protein
VHTSFRVDDSDNIGGGTPPCARTELIAMNELYARPIGRPPSFLELISPGCGSLWLDRVRNRQPSVEADQFWNQVEIRVLGHKAKAVVLFDPIFPADPFTR